MANNNEEWKNELLQRNEITEVIGEYVHLEKKGSRYWAACPWHAERNPSFCVNKEQQFFYCFSCKRGGSVINFIMEQEKRTYPEALQFLAERVGMEMPEYRNDEDFSDMINPVIIAEYERVRKGLEIFRNEIGH